MTDRNIKKELNRICPFGPFNSIVGNFNYSILETEDKGIYNYRSFSDLFEHFNNISTVTEAQLLKALVKNDFYSHHCIAVNNIVWYRKKGSFKDAKKLKRFPFYYITTSSSTFGTGKSIKENEKYTLEYLENLFHNIKL